MKPAPKRSNRQPRKSLLQLGVALALCSSALGAEAAGLGRLNVLSSIGQPLRAEIDLTAVGNDEVNSLVARLAAPDAFAQANIEYDSMLTKLRFSVQHRGNGQPYVLVTSTAMINEPFLDVLVELSWSSGRLVREYTLLIDPPGMRGAQRDADPGQVVPLPPVAPPRASRRAPQAASRVPPVSRPVPAEAPAPSGTTSVTSGGEYLVKSGDTASSIAIGNKTDGVSLEQMLAALYRDNPQAFAGNVNKLRAGATVKIPDAATAQAIDSGEARRIVAQSSNFSSSRERIAQNAAQAPTSRAAGQQASGQLSTRVDDTSVPPETRDHLQLSRPDAATKAGTKGGARTGVAGPSPEELAAKERELQETKTRQALLEKNVTDLQQLLALKNQTLTNLQKNAPATAATPTPATPPAATVQPAPAPAPVAAPEPAATPPAASVAAAPTPGPEPAPTSEPAPASEPAAAATPPAPPPGPATAAPAPAKAAPAPVAEDSWFDMLEENALLIIGLAAIIVLLIGYFLFTMRRRRKLSRFEDSIFADSVLHANSVFGTTGGQSVDTANSGFHSNFVPVAGNVTEQNEVDPVAEADVYVAYGRDAQAEEILKESLRANPARHAVRLKLLEIYAKRGDSKTFETMASELYAATGGRGEEWKQAAALGATVDPNNPLYGEAGASSSAAPVVATSVRKASSPGAPAGLATADLIGSDMLVRSKPASTAPAPAPVAEFVRTDPLPVPAPSPAATATSMALDFDLGFGNTGIQPLPAAPIPSARPPAAPPPAAPAPAASKDNSLDFDLGGATKPLVDPFTASAFGGGDPTSRTAVNLPAFRARADPEAPARADDGFTASDIFGSSIVADPDKPHDIPTTPKDPPPLEADEEDLPQGLDSRQFDKSQTSASFSRINLDLGQSAFDPTAVATEFSGRTDMWQAMATKLDLAVAYGDIGDKEGARELLEEVVRNGDQTQADRARKLIAELG
jgi:pilus assembly protein FimV